MVTLLATLLAVASQLARSVGAARGCSADISPLREFNLHSAWISRLKVGASKKQCGGGVVDKGCRKTEHC